MLFNFFKKEKTKICGWESIGNFLNCSYRTAMRREKDLNLPIYRDPVKGIVYSYKEDLYKWQTKILYNTSEKTFLNFFTSNFIKEKTNKIFNLRF